MAYVIKRTDRGGGYVSRPGSQSSYTNALQRARQYPTREAAQADACGNEIVLSLAEACTHGE